MVALGKKGPLCKLNGGALFFTHHFSMIYLHLKSLADLENFGGGGDFKHKTSKIRMSSPKLRVIFRPKTEIQTFFSPKIRWFPKKKRSSPKLRVIFWPKTDIQTFFSPKIRWSPKKKKKKVSKKVRKITLNFGEDIRIFEVLCLKSPHQNFLDPEVGGPLCICTLCTFLRPPLLVNDFRSLHNWPETSHSSPSSRQNKILYPKEFVYSFQNEYSNLLTNKYCFAENLAMRVM